MRRLLAIPLCLCVAAGCGGGNERLSAAEFRQKAEAACRSFGARFRALGTPQTLPGLVRFADKALPIAKEARDELRRLQPPEELESRYDRWVSSSDEAVAALERLRAAAKRRDLDEVRRIGREVAAEDRRADALARKLGLPACTEA